MGATEFTQVLKDWLERAGFEQVSVSQVQPMPKHAADWILDRQPGEPDDGADADDQTLYFRIQTSLGQFGFVQTPSLSMCDFTDLGVKLEDMCPEYRGAPDADLEPFTAAGLFCPIVGCEDHFALRLWQFLTKRRLNAPSPSSC